MTPVQYAIARVFGDVPVPQPPPPNLPPKEVPHTKTRDHIENLIRQREREAAMERHRQAALREIAAYVEKHAIRDAQRDPVEAELVAEAEEYARRRRLARAEHQRRVQFLAEAQERRRLGIPPDPRWFATGETL